jgi:uncharacterized protein (TIGR03492 family)
MRFLFISNGYGEDNVSAHIARVFPQYFPGCTVSGFPTVGGGKFYTDSGIDLAGRGPDLPSEGFVRSYKDLFNDILNGFFHKTFSLGVSLRKVSSHFDYLVLTGDPYLLLLNGIFTKKPKANRIFVGVQQSEWYGSKKAVAAKIRRARFCQGPQNRTLPRRKRTRKCEMHGKSDDGLFLDFQVPAVSSEKNPGGNTPGKQKGSV